MNHGGIMVSVEHFEACPPRLRWLFFYKVGPLQVINGILAPWSRVITLVTHFKVHLSGSFSISRNYGIFRWKDSEKGPKSDIHWFYVRRPWGYCVVCTKLIFSDMWNMVSLWYLHLVYWKIYATTFPLLAQINHQKENLMKNPSLLFQHWKKHHHFRPKTVLPKGLEPQGLVFFRDFFVSGPFFPKGWNEFVRSAMRSSTLTLFMSISGGLSWMEATDPLMNIGVSVVGWWLAGCVGFNLNPWKVIKDLERKGNDVFFQASSYFQGAMNVCFTYCMFGWVVATWSIFWGKFSTLQLGGFEFDPIWRAYCSGWNPRGWTAGTFHFFGGGWLRSWIHFFSWVSYSTMV